MLSDWSNNLRESDQKVIQRSYDGNIILTWYMIYRGRLDRGEPISIRAGFRTFVKRSLIARAVVALSSVSPRPRAARYQKSLVVRWRILSSGWEIKYPMGNESDGVIKRERGSFAKTTGEIYRWDGVSREIWKMTFRCANRDSPITGIFPETTRERRGKTFGWMHMVHKWRSREGSIKVDVFYRRCTCATVSAEKCDNDARR